jgi:hypothetical protein
MTTEAVARLGPPRACLVSRFHPLNSKEDAMAKKAKKAKKAKAKKTKKKAKK